jgi:hypothetical protein
MIIALHHHESHHTQHGGDEHHEHPGDNTHPHELDPLAHPIDITISPNHAQKIIQFLSSYLTEHVHKVDKDMASLFRRYFFLYYF